MSNQDTINQLFDDFILHLERADCIIERKLNKSLADKTGLRGIINSPGIGNYGNYIERYKFFNHNNIADFERKLYDKRNEFLQALMQVKEDQAKVQLIEKFQNKLWQLKSSFFSDPKTGHLYHLRAIKNIYGDPPELQPDEGEDDSLMNYQGVEEYIESSFSFEPFFPFINLQFQYLTQTIIELDRLTEISALKEKINKRVAVVKLSKPRYKFSVPRENAKKLVQLYEILQPRYLKCSSTAFFDFFDETKKLSNNITWYGSQSELVFLIHSINEFCDEIKKPKEFWQCVCSVFRIPGQDVLDPKKIKHVESIVPDSFKNNLRSVFPDLPK